MYLQNVYYIPKIGNSHPKGKLYYFVHNYARRIAKESDAVGNCNGAMEAISETEDQPDQPNGYASGNAYASYTSIPMDSFLVFKSRYILCWLYICISCFIYY